MSEPVPAAPQSEKRLAIRLPDQIPLWWRVISERAFATMRKQYQVTGVLPSTRLGMEQEIQAILRKDPDEDQLIRNDVKAHAFALLDDKLAILLADLYPKPFRDDPNGEPAGDAAVTFIPTRVNVSEIGIAFWAKWPRINRNDYLEMQFGLFSNSSMVVHCFAKVMRVTLEADGTTMVACRFELLSGNEKEQLGEQVAIRKSRMPTLIDPAILAPRLGSQTGTGQPAVRPEAPKPEIVAPPRSGPITPPPSPAAPVFSAEQLLDDVDLSDIPSPHPVSTQSRPSQSQDGNRRQDFRIDDTIPFSWKMLTDEDFAPIAAYFDRNMDILPRTKMELKQKMIADIDRRLSTMVDEIPTTERLLSWMRSNLDLLFMRSVTPTTEAHFYLLITRLLGITQELTGREQVSPRAGKLLAHLKRKMERQIRLAHFDPRGNLRDRDILISELKKLDQEIPKMSMDLRDEDPPLREKMKLFNAGLDEMNFNEVEKPSAQDEIVGPLVVSNVNMSATGLAFSTAVPALKKDAIVELRVVLSANGETTETFVTYGRIVMIKSIEGGKRQRAACQLLTMTTQLRETLFAHVVRKQREILSSRIEVRR